MTTIRSFPIKLEPVDDVILEIKTIETNIHKIICDDLNDEEIAASVVPSFNFDVKNRIKLEPAVDYTLELNYEGSDDKQGKGAEIDKSTRPKRSKRRHTAIVEEMLDVTKEESLEERIKKRPRRSNIKDAKNSSNNDPQAESPVKLQVKKETEVENLNISPKRNKKLQQMPATAKPNQKQQIPRDNEKQSLTNKKSKNLKQNLSEVSKGSKKISIKTPKNSKSNRQETETNSNQRSTTNFKTTKTTKKMSKIEKISSENLNSLQLSVKSTPKEASKKSEQSENSSKSSAAAKKPSKKVINLESSSDSEKSAPKTSTDSQLNSQSTEKSFKPALNSTTGKLPKKDNKDSKIKAKPDLNSNSTPADHKAPSTHPSALSTSSILECKKCFKQFTTKLKLYCHSKTHLPKIECKICGRKIQEYLMRRHLRHHKDNKPFVCDLCPSSFISIVSIRNHMYQHTTIKKFYCDVCGRGYNDNRHLREHKLGHTNPFAYRCDLCPKGYERKQALEAHMAANHMEDTKWYGCEICGYKTKMLTVIYSHKKRHYKTIECEDCGKKFSNRSELMDHSLAIHVKVKNVECKICGKFYASKRYMLKHIRRTHGECLIVFYERF